MLYWHFKIQCRCVDFQSNVLIIQSYWGEVEEREIVNLSIFDTAEVFARQMRSVRMRSKRRQQQ